MTDRSQHKVLVVDDAPAARYALARDNPRELAETLSALIDARQPR